MRDCDLRYISQINPLFFELLLVVVFMSAVERKLRQSLTMDGSTHVLRFSQILLWSERFPDPRAQRLPSEATQPGGDQKAWDTVKHEGEHPRFETEEVNVG